MMATLIAGATMEGGMLRSGLAAVVAATSLAIIPAHAAGGVAKENARIYKEASKTAYAELYRCAVYYRIVAKCLPAAKPLEHEARKAYDEWSEKFLLKSFGHAHDAGLTAKQIETYTGMIHRSMDLSPGSGCAGLGPLNDQLLDRCLAFTKDLEIPFTLKALELIDRIDQRQ